MKAILSLVWPYLIGTAVVVGAMLWLDHRGYQRATDDRAKDDAVLVRKFTEELGRIDAGLNKRIDTIDTTERTIVQPTLIRETTLDPRYRDPACRVTDGVLRGLNTARAASGAVGGDQRPVPTAGAPDR